MKYIVVTGGIISGLGKGITSSSIGMLFKCAGANTTAIKIDPYLNIDAGTISPNEHGECYVLQDGYESDLDLGNYERFMNIKLTKHHNITTGQIYNKVINDERMGQYLGKTVQIVPHITNEIKRRIIAASQIYIDGKLPDLCIIEVGGTVGDMEVSPFIEAIRQMRYIDNYDMYFIHLVMVLENKEIKTKPLQHSVINCRTLGLYPDMMVVRSTNELPDHVVKKISAFCQVPEINVINSYDVPNIYYVPNMFMKQNICEKINNKLKIFSEISINYNLNNYNNILEYFGNISQKPRLKLAIIAKYLESQDTYLSLIRAIEHASFNLDIAVTIEWIDSENYEVEESVQNLVNYDGFIIPGGFGSRGIIGKLNVAKYARTFNKPILGICLGMQIMTVDVYNITNFGTSSEWTHEYFNGATNVVDIIDTNSQCMGNSMRLGNQMVYIDENSKSYELYETINIVERHRHRYNVNHNNFDIINILDNNGLHMAGISDEGYIEIIEFNKNKFHIGCQFHPEYNTSYEHPHPLFIGLLQSMIKETN